MNNYQWSQCFDCMNYTYCRMGMPKGQTSPMTMPQGQMAPMTGMPQGQMTPMPQEQYMPIPAKTQEQMMPMETMPEEEMMPMETMPEQQMMPGTQMAPMTTTMPGQQAIPQMDMEEEQLKMMYPTIYILIAPMIKQQVDMMEAEHGKMYCPKQEHVEEMCDRIYKNIEKDLDEKCGHDEDDKDDMRIRRYGRRHAVRDLAGILLLNELIRRRRRRRRPHHHYHWGY